MSKSTPISYQSLCPPCQKAVTAQDAITQPMFAKYPGSSRETSRQALSFISGRGPCPLCRLFMSAYSAKISGIPPINEEIALHGITLDVSKRQRQLSSVPQRMAPWELTFLMVRGHGPSDVLGRAIWREVDYGFFERAGTIRGWVADCGNHEICISQREKRRPLPTRLIDLGGDHYRIVETASLSGEVQYTTLSHRWGEASSQLLKSTTANIQQFRHAIPIDSIPKTFNDALMITHALGLRYIWIDSLCIIQDQDWSTEASKMANVYNGSYLNIAANNALDSGGGCFLNSLVSPTRITGCPDGIDTLLRVPCGNIDTIQQSPLSQRGWVFQELILAPRILYCASNQFYWQCSTCSASEDGVIFQAPSLFYHTESASSKNTNLSANWMELAETFTTKTFTFESDRIAAMAGVTKLYTEQCGWTPILGLWKESFVEGLLWSVRPSRDSDTKPIRTKLVNLPSWTWYNFSQCKLHNWQDKDDTISRTNLLQVQDVGLNWEKEPLTSGIKSTHLLLKGRVSILPIRREDLQDLDWRSLHPKARYEHIWLDEQFAYHSNLVQTEVHCLAVQYRPPKIDYRKAGWRYGATIPQRVTKPGEKTDVDDFGHGDECGGVFFLVLRAVNDKVGDRERGRRRYARIGSGMLCDCEIGGIFEGVASEEFELA